MVGNGETDYVSQDVLIHELGKDKASQVHIVETPQDVAALFQAENYGASSKACWNYARTLRSYNGKGRILLLEDDVELAIGAFRQLRPWLDAPLEESVSLYNGICHKDNLLKAPLFSQLAVANKSIRRSSDFPTIQAMLFSASITREAGEYLISRANRETHDYMLGRVLATRSRKMSFVYPSIFQHRGFITTGLSGPDVPVSKCYQGEFRDR